MAVTCACRVAKDVYGGAREIVSRIRMKCNVAAHKHRTLRVSSKRIVIGGPGRASTRWCDAATARFRSVFVRQNDPGLPPAARASRQTKRDALPGMSVTKFAAMQRTVFKRGSSGDVVQTTPAAQYLVRSDGGSRERH